MVLFHPIHHRQRLVAILEAVVLALFHEPLQGGGIGPVLELPPGSAVDGNDAVPVGYGGDVPAAGANGLAHLGGEFLQVPHGGVFAEDHAPILFCIDLQGITLTDAKGTPDLLGNDNTT